MSQTKQDTLIGSLVDVHEAVEEVGKISTPIRPRILILRYF
ncbi:MAG: hypothetical protein V8S36_07695 [Lachnospiraceae bacterium]